VTVRKYGHANLTERPVRDIVTVHCKYSLNTVSSFHFRRRHMLERRNLGAHCCQHLIPDEDKCGSYSCDVITSYVLPPSWNRIDLFYKYRALYKNICNFLFRLFWICRIPNDRDGGIAQSV